MPGRLDLSTVMRAAQTADPAAMVDLVGLAVRQLGATDVVAYLVDYEQLVLEPLPDRATHADLPAPEAVGTTAAGRAFLTGSPVTTVRPDGVRVWVPIVEASDRVGVLAMTVDAADEPMVNDCVDAGIVAGYLIAAHTRCTDLYEIRRRRKAMSLAASMQWDLLPPLVLEAPGCTVAGRLEPAYEVGGDCFDYALNGPVLDMAMIDAMGHGVDSSTIASLALGCYRHGRRESQRLDVLHGDINGCLTDRCAGEAFATGQLARLELEAGVLTWTNAGHPRPLLVRQGQEVRQLDGEIGLPWGLELETPAVATEQLEPGDAILFFTDGVVEASASDGADFGVQRLGDVTSRLASQGQRPEAIVRRVLAEVLDHRGTHLRDDATIVLLEWRNRN